MKAYDKLWISLPTETWRELFNLAIQANKSVNEYLQALIERQAQDLVEAEKTQASP